MFDNIQKEILNWCEENVTVEIAEKLDQGECPVSLYKSIAAMGWLKYANISADPNNLSRLAEVCKIINSYSGVLGNMICVNAACAMMLGNFGGEIHRRAVNDILAGNKLAAFALTEPQAGTDVYALESRGCDRGDHWEITGDKYLTTGAQVADFILVVARTNSDGPLNKGTSLMIVPSGAEGMSIHPIPKMACNGYASCRITLDKVKINADAVVGSPNTAWPALALGGAIERILVAACCVGLSKTIGKYLYNYAQDRQVSGQSLYELTNISHQIIDIAVQVRAADALLNQAIQIFVTGGNPTNAVAAAKVFAANMQQEVCMSAMRVMGGRAYLKEFPVERWMREGLLALWAGGTNELQKNLMSRDPFSP